MNKPKKQKPFKDTVPMLLQVPNNIHRILKKEAIDKNTTLKELTLKKLAEAAEIVL